MDYEEYQRKALEPIVNYIESVMASYSKEEIEAIIKKALPEKKSEDEKIRKMLIERVRTAEELNEELREWIISYLEKQKDKRELDFAEGKVEGIKQTCQEIKDAMSLFGPKDLTPFELTFRDYIDSAIRYCLAGEGYQQYIKEWAADLLNLEKQKEQKPSTPKYRVGDVMRTKQEAAKCITDGLPVIVSVDDNYYYCTNEKIPISEQEEYEFPPMNMKQKPAASWTIQDARPGDILNSVRVQATIIFKGFNPDGKHIDAYCALQKGFFIAQELPWDRDFEPATQFWKDALFDAMVRKGYLWDAENKRLNKAVQKPAEKSEKPIIPEWSEEDEAMLNAIIKRYGFAVESDCAVFIKTDKLTQMEKELAWLKSLHPQPKAELTLLDENIINAAVAFVEQNNHFNCWLGVDKHTVIKALRSLKPH